VKVCTVCIGSSREQKLPSLVLEHSIRKHAHTQSALRVIHTYDKTFPSPKKPENRSRTGFSFARFAIPEMVGYEGLAAYLECDQLVFKDVAALFAIPFEGATVLRPRNQASVLVIDCDHVRWDVSLIVKSLDEGMYTYRDLMEHLCIVPKIMVSETIPDWWNSLEYYEPGKTALLHYTNMDTQPWRRPGHRLRHLWMNALKESVREGAISRAIVEEETRLKHIIPEVLTNLG
jgi:lipopolysaccharide biosynthesis glycosyltransferase